jgi:hypothetical protein
MRQLTCDCGATLTAEDDQALQGEVRSHVSESHPDMQLSDEQVEGLVAQKAEDA